MNYTLTGLDASTYGTDLILRLQIDDVDSDLTFQDENVDVFFFCHPHPVTLAFYGFVKRHTRNIKI